MTSILINVFFAIAAVWALTGTNTQATLARARFRNDPEPAIPAALRVWAPIRWMTSKRKAEERRRLERTLRTDAAAWARYDLACKELRSWNALESSVAVALAAALMAAVLAIVDL